MMGLERSGVLRAFTLSHAIAIAALALPLLAVLSAHAVERALASLTGSECATANACPD
jgi:hypothetical protein